MEKKLRLFVPTDISTLDAAHGEPDDTQSLVRLLLYANELDITGIAATYTKHTVGVNPAFIRDVIAKYAQVRDNLLLHSPGYPSAKELLSRVVSGNPDPGLDQVGERKDTEASGAIIAAVDQSEQPLWIAAWGGVTDLAQALWRVSRDRSPGEAARFVSKLRVYAIGDQYDDCGPWIRENYREMFYVIARHTYRGMYRMGEAALVGKEWVERFVKGKGPLADAYPVYDGGDIYSGFLGRVEGVKEGDTPSFLYLLQRDLADPERPELGGWGGRFAAIPGTRAFTDACDFAPGACDEFACVYRYRRDFQADFASRASWCVLPPDKGARRPEVELVGGTIRSVRYGEDFTLECKAAHQRGEALAVHWRYYPEPSSYKGRVLMRDADAARCVVRIPHGGGAGDAQAHFVFTARPLGANEYMPVYRRVIVNISV